MELGAFIITFNRPSRLRETIERALAQTRAPQRLLVVDNGDPDVSRPILDSCDPTRLTYHAFGENRGPAGAAAYALRRLTDEGCEWVCWGDDDTPPLTEDTFERLLALAAGAGGDGVGGMGAVGARFDWATGELERLPDAALRGAVEVDSIGSGQQLITHRSVVERVGLPDERLFFGFYDPLYCLRIRRSGYRLLIDGELMTEYRANAGRLGLDLKPSLGRHRPLESHWRRYYVTRNYTYMMRRTFARPDLARREALKAVLRSAAAWRYGPRYALHFGRLQLRGVVDGYRGRLGRTVEPVPKRYDRA
jgi:glycosyltransferase involved in cell wall biosynthesis